MSAHVVADEAFAEWLRGVLPPGSRVEVHPDGMTAQEWVAAFNRADPMPAIRQAVADGRLDVAAWGAAFEADAVQTPITAHAAPPAAGWIVVVESERIDGLRVPPASPAGPAAPRP